MDLPVLSGTDTNTHTVLLFLHQWIMKLQRTFMTPTIAPDSVFLNPLSPPWYSTPITLDHVTAFQSILKAVNTHTLLSLSWWMSNISHNCFHLCESRHHLSVLPYAVLTRAIYHSWVATMGSICANSQLRPNTEVLRWSGILVLGRSCGKFSIMRAVKW